jgi:hypothetical protein
MEFLGLSKDDSSKVLKGAGIAGGGALAVYLLEAIPLVGGLGEWGPVVAAICSVLINIIRKKMNPTQP